MNIPFAVLENLKEPQTRLRHMQLDLESGAFRIEYDLDSMARTSTVTAALNAGYERPPWQLESAVNTQAGAGLAGNALAVRGVWSSRLERLH